MILRRGSSYCIIRRNPATDSGETAPFFLIARISKKVIGNRLRDWGDTLSFLLDWQFPTIEIVNYPPLVSLVELALATNAQLRPDGEMLHKQVRRAWNMLYIFPLQTQHKGSHARSLAYLSPQRSVPVGTMEYSAQITMKSSRQTMTRAMRNSFFSVSISNTTGGFWQSSAIVPGKVLRFSASFIL